MCGIFGVIARSNERLSGNQLDALTRKLFLQSQTRGKDASGVLCVLDDTILVHKEARMAAHLLRSDAFAKVMSSGTTMHEF